MDDLKLKDPRTCRIFFSSPFGGMEGEREELTKKYFPQIHHFCNKYGVNFVAVDMRWGITSEASASSQVINICLRELDRSDFFAGFFGQRYGWHGRDDNSLQENFDNAVGRYPWLDNVRDKSVTELEFLHGHLNNPGTLPAVLCFRNKEYDDKEREEGKKRGDKKQVFKYSPESELSTQLMEDLKQRCSQTKDKTYGVHLSYPNPQEGAKIIFDAIWKYLNKVLPKQRSAETETKRSILLAQHDAFLASRQKMYGVQDENLSSLLNLINKESSSPLLVTGTSGCGKSTLLSVFISKVKSEYKSQFCLVYHCVGHAEESTDPGQILQRLTDEFEFAVDVMEGREEKNKTSKRDVEDVRDIINQLSANISKVQSKGKQCILVIDGVDKVTKTSRTEEVLFWLPRNLPGGTIMIVSANSSESDIIEELVTNRSFDKLEIQELSEEMRQEISVKMLMEVGKELSPSQMRKIRESSAAKNPLYLKVLLNELIVFGYFRLLDEKIDSLLKSGSVDELFEKVLERLEADYRGTELEGNLVEQVTSVICLSRQGMSEAELTDMFSLPSHVWSPFFFSVEKYFIDQRGLIQFGFREFKDAVKRKYLADENSRKKYVQCIADYFEDQKQKLSKLHSVKNNELTRISVELPFAYHTLRDTEKLGATLSDLSVLSYLIEGERYITEVYDLWESTGYTWSEITGKYLAAVDLQVADLYIKKQEEGSVDQESPGLMVIDDLWNVNTLLKYVHYFDGCEKILERILDINEKNCKEIDRTKNVTREAALYELAVTYHHNSKLQKSTEIHQQVLEIREMRVPDISNADKLDLAELGNSYNGIGTNYLITADYEKAEEYLKKSLECAKIGNAKNDMASCYLNLGNVYLATEDYDKAMEYLEEAIQLTKEIYFGHQPLSLGLLYNNIGVCCRKLNQVDDAEKYYQMSLDVKRNTVGNHHPLLCQTYISLSVIETLRNNNLKALEYNQLAAEIYKESGTPENDIYYTRCRENVIVNLINLKKMADAVELYLPFFEFLEKEMNNGNVHLINGTLPFAHADIVKYLIQSKQDKVTQRVLKILIKTKVVIPIYYVYLDEVNMRLNNPGEKAPKALGNEGAMSVDEALQKWPGDRSLLEYKFRNLIDAGNSETLIDSFNNLCPRIYNFGSLLNFVLEMFATSKTFNNKMFLEFNINALNHLPENEVECFLNCLRNTAESYEREKQPEKALGYYTQWTEQDKDNPYPYLKVCYCLAMVGDIEEAKKYCTKAKEKANMDGNNQTDIQQKILTMWSLLEEAEKEMNKES
ncbi:TPR repeat-containing protein DDB_G0287407-like [Saccostrea echinata]|uniref:TPR repeat-containing protein DDB_G0287407-like n=1 Tax=Saccostrea echinata TaxID=191078 RepID=UPI002A81D6D0|nr:TPR repeat-containing protein DDB_G0287407-like [Saccostrea echinata]